MTEKTIFRYLPGQICRVSKISYRLSQRFANPVILSFGKRGTVVVGYSSKLSPVSGGKRMSHLCGEPTAHGTRCAHLVKEPGQMCPQHQQTCHKMDPGCSYRLTSDRLNVYCVAHNNESSRIAVALGAELPCQRWIATWPADAAAGGPLKRTKVPASLAPLYSQYPYYGFARKGRLNKEVPIDGLIGMVKDPRIRVRNTALRHPLMPAAVLRQAWQQASTDIIRSTILHNPSCPTDVLLAGTKGFFSLRYQVSTRHNLPEHLIRELLAQGHIQVLKDQSKRLPMPLVESLIREGDSDQCILLAQNMANASVLQRLSVHQDPAVRHRVALNDAALPDVLRKLLTDPDEEVRKAAQKNSYWRTLHGGSRL